jgi:hypothetical protein
MDAYRILDVAALAIAAAIPPLVLRSDRSWRGIVTAAGAAWVVLSAWMVIVEYVVDDTGFRAATMVAALAIAALITLAYSTMWSLALAAITAVAERFEPPTRG